MSTPRARKPGSRSPDGTGLTGPFDAVFLLECLHDMARPVEVLSECRTALAEGGAVVVADEKVADQFTAPGDLLERMMYGWSVTHCLPVAMAEHRRPRWAP